MDLLFRIFHFSSLTDLAEEVTERLNRGESKTRAKSFLIGEGELFSISSLSESPAFSIVIIDYDNIGSIVRLQKQEEHSPQANSTLLVCVNMKQSEPILLGYPYFVLVRRSAEQIRMEIMDFYRGVLNKQHSTSSFIGRTQEIDQFQSLLYSERNLTTKAIVVSGRQGVGREAFVRQCIKLSMDGEIKEPCIISMGDNGSIEFFLVQLNSFLQKYGEEQLRSLLASDIKIKVEVAASLLNHLFSFGKYVIVYDDARSCIRYDRKIADWFQNILSSPELSFSMRLFVISTVTVNFTRTKVIDDVGFFNLYDLSRADRKKLIYKRLSDKETAASEEDVNFILDSSIYSPRILLQVVDDYCQEGGIKYIKTKMDSYLSISDSGLRSIVLRYKNRTENDLWNVFILLSKIEYLSTGVLQAIFVNKYDDIIQRNLKILISDGLVERSGETDEFYRLDSSVRDYLRRNKYKYDDESFENHVDEVMSGLIADNPRITEDYSVYLYKVKKDLSQSRMSTDALLIPSIVVSTIIEAYNTRDYDKTIDLCNWVLEEKTHYFNDVYREIRYWKCLALARKKNNQFYECVDYFKYNADYFFLMGFMYRIKREYFKAETELRKALQINPSFGRAKRELVTALQKQHKFSEALALAKDNYERDSENSYHLLAYYRCLVRKRGLSYDERQEVIRLLDEAKELFNSSYYYDAMRFEYDRFIIKKPIPVLLNEVKDLEKIGKEKDAPLLLDIANEFKVLQGLGSIIKYTDLDYEFDR